MNMRQEVKHEEGMDEGRPYKKESDDEVIKKEESSQ